MRTCLFKSSLMKCIDDLAYYNYSNNYPTVTNLTQLYGDYRTVEPFDPPTQNTIT